MRAAFLAVITYRIYLSFYMQRQLKSSDYRITTVSLVWRRLIFHNFGWADVFYVHFTSLNRTCKMHVHAPWTLIRFFLMPSKCAL